MNNLIERLAVVIVMALCIFLLFIGGTSVKAETEHNVLRDIKTWQWPLQLDEGRFTDYFGTRGGTHKGVDIAAPTGTAIMAANDGIVYFSGYRGSYGNVIMVKHENGLETLYAHLHKRFVVEGTEVKKGEIIGTVGSTGNSTGPHLHFELHNGEWNSSRTNAVNPLDYFVLEQETDERERKILFSPWTMQDKKLIEFEEVKQQKIKKTITIKKNDTLWDIAQVEQVTVASIMEWNDLKSDLIFPGQEIFIYDEDTYVVQSGETIEDIADSLDVEVDFLVALNDLSHEFLYPNQILKIK
ncbi:hypothetical protein BC6307_13815 [Sutcliffiella cohnii]|uniref:LysM domain-containing protein n=1 Tax=Sutcliffiella cohnii TaxID=33932 RepID=A0A223KSD9_9BACI|nr:M23 family metallopeptidase [Sutcliffiella cohnii]AST92287.1 hypothetical protein BC6307_13815 [Sutcliffiella cohnii]